MSARCKRLLVLGILTAAQIGCAGVNRRLKAWLDGDSPNEAPKSQLTKFSENGDLVPPVRRQYHRTTKESLSDQASLDAKSGSLWAMEGQGAYLFAPNIVRLVGDSLAVQIEGDPKDQLNSKVAVIRKLLAKIEERRNQSARGPASATPAEEAPAAEPAAAATADATKPGEKKEGADDLGIKTVPTRVIERTVEGNYRVKGQQPFFVKNHEYKVIVTGVVKAEDFNDDGIAASKLIDPKFDIVTARRREVE
jgi:flagellar L-ring protein precursor FlgH